MLKNDQVKTIYNMEIEIENSKSRWKALLKKNWDVLLAGVFLSIVLILVLTPQYRERLQKLTLSDKKEVLSTASGRVSAEGPSVVITKVRQRSKLWVEVYKIEVTSGATQFWQSLPLDSFQDAYLGFNVKASNLALLDLDHDGLAEIVAPSFDDQMNPRLNIFKYDVKSGLFMEGK